MRQEFKVLCCRASRCLQFICNMSRKSWRQCIIFIAKFDLNITTFTFPEVIQKSPITKYNYHLPISSIERQSSLQRTR